MDYYMQNLSRGESKKKTPLRENFKDQEWGRCDLFPHHLNSMSYPDLRSDSNY